MRLFGAIVSASKPPEIAAPPRKRKTRTGRNRRRAKAIKGVSQCGSSEGRAAASAPVGEPQSEAKKGLTSDPETEREDDRLADEERDGPRACGTQQVLDGFVLKFDRRPDVVLARFFAEFLRTTSEDLGAARFPQEDDFQNEQDAVCDHVYPL